MADSPQTYSVELVPICRDDLVALPIPLAKQSGNISPLVVCHKVSTSVYFLDPQTLATMDIGPDVYWRAPFPGKHNPGIASFDRPDVIFG